jgi:hypothetical protein
VGYRRPWDGGCCLSKKADDKLLARCEDPVILLVDLLVVAHWLAIWALRV